MATLSRSPLSASSNGRPIKVAATASPGTLLHTVSGTVEEIYIWVSNSSASPVTLTIEFGGTTNPDDHIVHAISIPGNSIPYPIVTGQSLASGSVRAFASSANLLVCTGHVNRIT